MREIEKYVEFRNKLKAEFMDKYHGLNIDGTDYREYIFNFFEQTMQDLLASNHKENGK